jgi:hypothetical protein
VNPDVAEALAAVPWLARLRALLGHGVWVTHLRTADGRPSRLDALVYSRCWPDFTGDALLIRSETDATALRLDADGYRVWEISGGAREVVEALLDLPDPGRPHAPRLAYGRVTGPLRSPARMSGS